MTIGLWRAKMLRAGSVHLNSFRVSINVVLPGLRCFVPHRGWDVGRASPERRSNPYAAAEISCGGHEGSQGEVGLFRRLPVKARMGALTIEKVEIPAQ